METSALTGYNIDEMFLTISKHLYIENSSKLDNFREDGNYNDGNTETFNPHQNRNVKLYADKSGGRKQ